MKLNRIFFSIEFTERHISWKRCVLTVYNKIINKSTENVIWNTNTVFSLVPCMIMIHNFLFLFIAHRLWFSRISNNKSISLSLSFHIINNLYLFFTLLFHIACWFVCFFLLLLQSWLSNSSFNGMAIHQHNKTLLRSIV